MEQRIEQIYGLLKAAGGGESSAWCCLDKVGSVLYASDGLVDLLATPREVIMSIYQFNPEWSYLKWQEVYAKLDNKQIIETGTKYLASGELNDCEISLIAFPAAGENYVLYKINQEKLSDDLYENESQEVIADNIEDTSKEDIAYNFSYDQLAPNPVIYFDEDGIIVFSNLKMISLNDPNKSGKTNVENLFLESELGPLVPSLLTYPEQNDEIIIRMIMKSSKKMLDGFARCSIFTNREAPAKFRLEFLISEGMQLVDQPLENAMAELDRIKGELDDTKIELKSNTIENFSFQNIISRSPNYKAVLRQVAQVADTDTTVLITGETGTGKELLCNALYKLSDRADEILVKINCASIPHDLIESSLFGHEKGSFTGADERKIGKFELANGGTIFLDEIGEMPLDLQPKLLRVLQEGEIERIGNPSPIKVDVRVIAATNRNLERFSKEGKFRPDLYYRLNVFPIYNIPLRDRADDIPLLIDHFLEKANKKIGKNVKYIRSKDLSALKKFQYPGNVRELENIIMRSVILAQGDEASFSFLFQGNPNDNDIEKNAFFSYDDMIINHLKQALEIAEGKVTGDGSASEMLGINGKTLASKLRKYNIDPKEYKK